MKKRSLSEQTKGHKKWNIWFQGKTGLKFKTGLNHHKIKSLKNSFRAKNYLGNHHHNRGVSMFLFLFQFSVISFTKQKQK